MKTGHQIETDIFNMLKGSALSRFVKGGLYRSGTRPRDSREEDIVVIFTTADAEQVQQGVFTIHVYVPDLLGNPNNGVMLENIARTEAIENKLMEEVRGWTAALSDYKFKLKDAVHSVREESIQQTFVVARVAFSIY